jgi:chromosome segregation ATPase
LDAKNQEQAAKINDLEPALEAKTQEHEALKSDHDDLQLQHDHWKNAHDAKDQELDETKTAKQGVEAENDSLKADNANKDAIISAKDNKINELEAAAVVAAAAAAALYAEVCVFLTSFSHALLTTGRILER